MQLTNKQEELPVSIPAGRERSKESLGERSANGKLLSSAAL